VIRDDAHNSNVVRNATQPIARFAAIFALSTVGGFLLLQTPQAVPVMWRLKTWTSEIVAAMVTVLGTPAIADGSYVRFADRWIHVIDECTGIYAAILLGAFLVAFPHPWRRRLTGLVIGIAVVAALNLARLVALALLMVRRPSAADFVHDYLWQVIWAGVLVAFAVVVVRHPDATR
jgi:exosortase/archaeosortase family protein